MAHRLIFGAFSTFLFLHCHSSPIDDRHVEIPPQFLTRNAQILDEDQPQEQLKDEHYVKASRRIDEAPRAYQYYPEDSSAPRSNKFEQPHNYPTQVPKELEQILKQRPAFRLQVQKPVVEQYLKEVTPTTQTVVQKQQPYFPLNLNGQTAILKQEHHEESNEATLRHSPLQYLLQSSLQQQPQVQAKTSYEPETAKKLRTPEHLSRVNIVAYQNALLAQQKLTENQDDSSRSLIHVPQANSKKPIHNKLVKSKVEDGQNSAQNVDYYAQIQQLQKLQQQLQQQQLLHQQQLARRQSQLISNQPTQLTHREPLDQKAQYENVDGAPSYKNNDEQKPYLQQKRLYYERVAQLQREPSKVTQRYHNQATDEYESRNINSEVKQQEENPYLYRKQYQVNVQRQIQKYLPDDQPITLEDSSATRHSSEGPTNIQYQRPAKPIYTNLQEQEQYQRAAQTIYEKSQEQDQYQRPGETIYQKTQEQQQFQRPRETIYQEQEVYQRPRQTLYQKPQDSSVRYRFANHQYPEESRQQAQFAQFQEYSPEIIGYHPSRGSSVTYLRPSKAEDFYE